MQKFYHKKFVFFVLLPLLLFVYLAPLFEYLPVSLDLLRSFLRANGELRGDGGKVNFLVLGLGGQKNEPSGLTDTIIFSSFSKKEERGLLLSLPRDIWIPEMRAKLNTAYYYGNSSDGLGVEWAKRYVSQITGQNIHYSMVVSFDGFVKIIDLLGGVDVMVERSFTDEKYPREGVGGLCAPEDTGCFYETVSFDEGKQHFSGENALKFARSRNASGAEGSDFARAGRQQKIIIAVKEKLLSLGFLINPYKVRQLLDLIGESVEMDIPQSHLGSLAKLLLSLDSGKIQSRVLEADLTGEGESLLINPSESGEYDGQWVLVPAGGSWIKVNGWVDCLLKGGECPVSGFVD